MNPMRGVFGILFFSLHADTQRHLFAFVGTGLDRVRKRNHFPLRTIGQACFITQGIQLPFYSFDIIGHLGNGTVMPPAWMYWESQ